MSYIVAHARKVGTAVGLANVGAHNCRETVYGRDGEPLGDLPEWISRPERAGLNEGDRCGGAAILKRRGERIRSANLTRKPQRNAAAAIEVTVSASPDWFGTHKIPEWKSYFSDARKMLENRYGKDNVLHWAVHYDETTPHMHVLLAPIVQGKNGPRYSSSEFLGGRKGLRGLQDELANTVGASRGLERGQRGSEARHTDQYQWAAKTAAESDALAMERGGLDLRARELDKREREVERKETALLAKIKSNGVILQNTVAERATIKALLSAYPERKLLEVVSAALHGLTEQNDINAAWQAMRDRAEELRQKNSAKHTQKHDKNLSR